MLLDKRDNITIVTQEKASIIELVKKLTVLYERFKNDNVIVNLTTLTKIPVSEIIEFLQISNQHRNNKRSFVIVTDKINFDDAPEELVIVPSLQEAKDIIEMEEIERDLGF